MQTQSSPGPTTPSIPHKLAPRPESPRSPQRLPARDEATLLTRALRTRAAHAARSASAQVETVEEQAARRLQERQDSEDPWNETTEAETTVFRRSQPAPGRRPLVLSEEESQDLARMRNQPLLLVVRWIAAGIVVGMMAFFWSAPWSVADRVVLGLVFALHCLRGTSDGRSISYDFPPPVARRSPYR